MTYDEAVLIRRAKHPEEGWTIRLAVQTGEGSVDIDFSADQWGMLTSGAPATCIVRQPLTPTAPEGAGEE